MSTTGQAGYPVDAGIAVPDHIANWRPLVHWLLVIPHLLLVYVLGLVERVVVFIGWFAALFTGRMPDGMANFVAGYYRYAWRVMTYAVWLREPYPSFQLPSGVADDGSDPAWLQVSPDRTLSRLAVLFRGLLIIPQAIALFFVLIAAYVAVIIAFFAVLFTGRWPVGLANFVIGALRWSLRVNMWYSLLANPYPPFSLQ
jgi:hypothetical protein